MDIHNPIRPQFRPHQRPFKALPDMIESSNLHSDLVWSKNEKKMKKKLAIYSKIKKIENDPPDPPTPPPHAPCP